MKPAECGGNDPRGVGFDVYNKSEMCLCLCFIGLISMPLFDNCSFHSNSVFRLCKILKANVPLIVEI